MNMNKKYKIPDFYAHRKRQCVATNSHNTGLPLSNLNSKGHQSSGNVTDVYSALILLKSYFPVEKFEQRLPPIIIKHQLYSVINNKTTVDRQLNELKQSGAIRCFHLGAQTDNVCIVLKEDFIQHVKNVTVENEVSIDKFLNYIITNNYNELSISRETLLSKRICKEEEITGLMKLGLLTVRDVGSWWLSIPGTGQFMKFYLKGRKAILTMIRKCKYSEILETELINRKLPKMAKLGMDYYIHDIIGAEMISIVPTTSGRLFRLIDED